MPLLTHAGRSPLLGRLGGLWAYVGLIVACAGLFLLIRQVGRRLPAGEAPVAVAVAGAAGRVAEPAPPNVVLHVVATLAAVIAAGFVLGRLCRLVGQPAVIGEILAGIVLGPSVLGAVAPGAMHALMPSSAADPHALVATSLRTVAEVGVILYMFLVGLELNAAHFRGRAHAAIAVSHASIVVPFTLGAALALWLYPLMSHRGVSFTAFALFMGVAMSVTAFPVLARILTDEGMDKTELGVLALGCAAADDVTAWCLLAMVVGVAKAQAASAAVPVIAGAAAYVAVMLWVVRPLVARAARRLDDAGAPDAPLPRGVVAAALALVLLSSLATEAIGIHSVFGAFALGALVPHDSRIARQLSAGLKDVATALLLPGFFAFTGMRTRIGLVATPGEWLVCGAITLTATLGKFGGTLVAARVTGRPWRDAAALGALMNTRGLMELIVLNIGLDLGVISPTLFSMMVLMALATTVMTSPVVRGLLRPDAAGAPAAVPSPA